MVEAKICFSFQTSLFILLILSQFSSLWAISVKCRQFLLVMATVQTVEDWFI
jgi:hypothetical protein